MDMPCPSAEPFLALPLVVGSIMLPRFGLHPPGSSCKVWRGLGGLLGPVSYGGQSLWSLVNIYWGFNPRGPTTTPLHVLGMQTSA